MHPGKHLTVIKMGNGHRECCIITTGIKKERQRYREVKEKERAEQRKRERGREEKRRC